MAKRKVSTYHKKLGTFIKKGMTWKRAHAATRKALGTRKSSNPKTTKTKRKKSGSRSMAKKKRTNKRRKFTIPGALVSGIALGFFIKPDPTWYSPFEAIKAGRIDIAVQNYATNMIGYRADTGAIFDTKIGMKGLWALLAGFAIHKVATVFGLNRALGRARIPFLRV